MGHRVIGVRSSSGCTLDLIFHFLLFYLFSSCFTSFGFAGWLRTSSRWPGHMAGEMRKLEIRNVRADVS
jgi:hypothetical protein